MISVRKFGSIADEIDVNPYRVETKLVPNAVNVPEFKAGEAFRSETFYGSEVVAE